MTEPSSTIYALHDIEEQERRRALLHSSHIARLTEYVNRLRNQLGYGREIPYFDPLDGGINARLLFLLEAPGRKAVDSGFISRDNPDPSARNMAQVLDECRIPREETVLWNIVPWYVGDQTRIRPVNQKDVKVALSPLEDLRLLLPRVRVVILVGRKAQRARLSIGKLFQTPVLECWHPSQRSLNVWPQKREEIKAVFRQAVQIGLAT
jgi:uracil-DNA glycosylase